RWTRTAVVVWCVAAGCQHAPTASDPVSERQMLAREAARVIEANALGADGVDWPGVLRRLELSDPALEPADGVRLLLGAYADPHAGYQTAEEASAWREARPPASHGSEAESSRPNIPERPW